MLLTLKNSTAAVTYLYFQIQICFLSTHADGQSVDISCTVCLFFVFVCTVTDFSGEDKASVVKFCTVVHQRPGQGISNFGELCSPRNPKSDQSATTRKYCLGCISLPTINVVMRRSWNIVLLVDVGRHVWIYGRPWRHKWICVQVWLRSVQWPPRFATSRLGAKKLFLGPTLNFDRTYLCNGTWYQQSESNLSIYRDSPTCPQIWWTLVHKGLRTVGEFLPAP